MNTNIKGSLKLRKPLKSAGVEHNELAYDFDRITNVKKYLRKMDEAIGQNIFVNSDMQKLQVFAMACAEDGIDAADVLERLGARDQNAACEAGGKWFQYIDRFAVNHVKYDEEMPEENDEKAMRPAIGAITLDEPIEWNGMEIKEIRFDFENLTAAQLSRAKDKAPIKTVGIYSFEQAYYVFLEAVKAGKQTNSAAVAEKADIQTIMCGVTAAWVFCLSAVREG